MSCIFRLDQKNVGGIKTSMFLRLINYKPNQLIEFGQQMDILRTKSCITDQNSIKKAPKKPPQQKQKQIEASLKSESISYFDRRNISAAKLVENSTENFEEKVKPIEVVVDENTVQTAPKSLNSSNYVRTCETTLSEVKIKSMVNTLKNNYKFGFNDDLVVYLNNRVCILANMALSWVLLIRGNGNAGGGNFCCKNAAAEIIVRVNMKLRKSL